MAEMSEDKDALSTLLTLLDLEQLEVNLFRGHSQREGWQRVYGGQVLGQALVAAGRTVEAERIAHSIHCYFLLGGDPQHPIIYDVDRIRDGGSFTTRRVTAIQHGRAIFAMSASFHRPEESYSHQAEMPDIPPPEDLAGEKELLAQFGQNLPPSVRNYLMRTRPIEMRPVDPSRYVTRKPQPARQAVWMRAAGQLGDDVHLHQCILAYASDFTLLDTALIAHGRLVFDADLQLASLDHAMWFHQSFRADEWLLYVQDSPWAGKARAFCRGSIYRRDGTLIASATQEGLVRKRRQ